jgi:ATP-dependent helicase/DNAse subunit B
MSKKDQGPITLWQGSLDDHPTWQFYHEEIRRMYDDLNTNRDRAYVDYELIKRAARVAYAQFLEKEATSFLQSYAKMTWSQANNMVEAISREIGRVEIQRLENE